MNALAERLRACREKLHLSQEYVANYMDMGRATVTQIELGNRKGTAEELDEKDQEEIMHLIQFKKMMKNKRLK